MARYCFYCPACGTEYQTTASPSVGPVAPFCVAHAEMVECERDWKAEHVGIGNLLDLKHDREMGASSNAAGLFLPENKDFAGPGDQDGNKGMRAWREKHRPKASNKKPYWPGSVDKKVF